ncbi:MarR family transcriptional regulator|uniref:DNA-binding transcriptional regulator, MarR family n=1 Tax=Dendrosporobacter quercicolus TaxID=146817 RepID=A0A1G9SI75_9FIRM|nr:MarR family transcriptional regulator [Dendrosporobacter quercicolus]NSL48710.1 MarR family transcriptional regulator [Dendrosporobacter quercicolus DSM 1736]SDM35102.1 DNA-binding transcriptional regulator, MarR family [Dendrosporobacter quercicolus]
MADQNSTELLFQLIPLLDKKFVRPVSFQMKPLLSPLQIHVLTVLTAKKATMTELAAEIVISKQQLTPIIDKLFTEGLVQREDDEADRRMIRISITDAGLKLLKSIKEKALSILSDKLEHLNRQDLSCLSGALTDLHRLVNKLP